ncbi:uncharacterized protein LOC109598685 isoform X2 [Aethina tumida]|uniref:uncharacterized protein LOC109598685 isoform X2 n=1 Tax=Aethina tumida TaxID=116153 RepID=UPI002148D227|nr:uncharacterized protein LOC109598685 isoform X2 [Aethina tumida]
MHPYVKSQLITTVLITILIMFQTCYAISSNNICSVNAVKPAKLFLQDAGKYLYTNHTRVSISDDITDIERFNLWMVPIGSKIALYDPHTKMFICLQKRRPPNNTRRTPPYNNVAKKSPSNNNKKPVALQIKKFINHADLCAFDEKPFGGSLTYFHNSKLNRNLEVVTNRHCDGKKKHRHCKPHIHFLVKRNDEYCDKVTREFCDELEKMGKKERFCRKVYKKKTCVC